MFPPLPRRPFFCSGPCVKPSEWNLDHLQDFLMGRSHRSREGVALFQEIIEGLRNLLAIPSSYKIALTPGSATCALEMALWNFSGYRSTQVLLWDVFSRRWARTLRDHLRCPYQGIEGEVPNIFSSFSPEDDLIFTWSGTTHGVWVGPHHSFLERKEESLVLCDATSAVFTTDLPWHLLDATFFSWQKGLGGEASSGVLVLSPKALHRLKDYKPPWPIPRLFSLTDNASLIEGLFRGEAINTPSMLLAQEQLFLLDLWQKKGGLSYAVKKTELNFSHVKSWCQKEEWIDFLVPYEPCRAQGPVVLKIVDKHFSSLPLSQQWYFVQKMEEFLAFHRAGFDCINHIQAVPGIRLWCGPTMENEDLEALFPWLSLAFKEVWNHFFYRS